MVVLTARSCFIDGLGTSFATGNLHVCLNNAVLIRALEESNCGTLWLEKKATIMGIVI